MVLQHFWFLSLLHDGAVKVSFLILTSFWILWSCCPFDHLLSPCHLCRYISSGHGDFCGDRSTLWFTADFAGFSTTHGLLGAFLSFMKCERGGKSMELEHQPQQKLIYQIISIGIHLKLSVVLCLMSFYHFCSFDVMATRDLDGILGQDILKSAFPQPVMFAFFCVVGSLGTDFSMPTPLSFQGLILLNILSPLRWMNESSILYSLQGDGISSYI